jgi:apolipoprotein N-acyltransferase
MLHGLTFLSGLCIVLAFTPWEFTFLIWFALVPWFYLLKRLRTAREAFIQGVWLSVLMSFGGFYWVASAIHHFGNLPWVLSVLCLIAFSTFNQPQLPLFAVLFHKLLPRTPGGILRRTLLFAFAYCALDWACFRIFTDSLGNAFHVSVIVRQLADVGGVLLLTFLILIVNLTLWEITESILAKDWASSGKIRLRPLLIFSSSFLICCLLYGFFRNSYIVRLTEQTDRFVQAGVIQANIGDFDKIAAERGVRGAAGKVLEAYYDLSERALKLTPPPDFLVWPETAYPSTFRTPVTIDEMNRDKAVERYVKENGIPLLFGGYARANHRDHNAFFFLHPTRQEGWGDLQVYKKYILLPFGEYIPGISNLNFVRQMFPQIGNFGLGEGPAVFQVPIVSWQQSLVKNLRVSPLICYEALFPYHTIAGARMGSELILNITNDSWFGPFGEPQLHFALTIFRGIETRLPQLRSTNTGISALVLPNGDVVSKTEIGATDVMNVRIPIIPPVFTVMNALGDWFGKACALVAVGLYVWIYRPRFKRFSAS